MSPPSTCRTSEPGKRAKYLAVLGGLLGFAAIALLCTPHFVPAKFGVSEGRCYEQLHAISIALKTFTEQKQTLPPSLSALPGHSPASLICPKTKTAYVYQPTSECIVRCPYHKNRQTHRPFCVDSKLRVHAFRSERE